MKKSLAILFFFPFLCFAQQQFSGVVKDSKTKEPLPFANIITNTKQGVTTDIGGNFTITSKQVFTTITVSYIGYKNQTITVSNKKNALILLQPLTENLDEVLISSKRENPALKIIKNTIANKKLNDVEKALQSFKTKAYNKLFVTANSDSISTNIDSVYKTRKGKRVFVKLDSFNYKFKKEISKRHVYLSEKISEYTFQKGKDKKEIILALKMAGFKRPIYELYAINIQDFSFYKENYTILGTKYINPIADNALKHYKYKILDTVSNGYGNSFIIHYKPTKKSALLGTEGVLYIDTKTFAITKGIAELQASLFIKASVDYTYIPSEKIWFPKQTSVFMKKGNTKGKMAVLGGMVVLNNQNKDTINAQKRGYASNQTYFSTKTTYFDIEINKPNTVKKSLANITIKENAYKKDSLYWKKYRLNPISLKDKKTYTLIDSIIKEKNFEKKIVVARSVLNGYFHTKYIDIDISTLFTLNEYQGVRFGFGGKTNKSLSNKFFLEGYLAYGTKDKKYKYKFDTAISLNKESNSWFGINHVNDLKETAALDFLISKGENSIINPRKINIFNFYNYKTWNTYLKHDILSNLEATLALSEGTYTPTFTYRNANLSTTSNSYKLSIATIGFYYTPFSKYMNSPIGKIIVSTKYPKISFQLQKSFKNIFKSNFDFTKLNFRVTYAIKPMLKSTTKFLLQGGIVFGNAPITHLYNATPNYTYKNPWILRTAFGGRNSFETMGYSEFISDKYFMLQMKHNFRAFKLIKMKPQISLVTRLGFGNIKNPEDHTSFPFKKMNKGYYESGLELNNMFKGLGISAFYRYGSYTKPIWSDNLALKITYHLDISIK